jgi:hypothetical protein
VRKATSLDLGRPVPPSGIQIHEAEGGSSSTLTPHARTASDPRFLTGGSARIPTSVSMPSMQTQTEEGSQGLNYPEPQSKFVSFPASGLAFRTHAGGARQHFKTIPTLHHPRQSAPREPRNRVRQRYKFPSRASFSKPHTLA